MGDEIEGAVQQAAHPGRQSMGALWRLSGGWVAPTNALTPTAHERAAFSGLIPLHLSLGRSLPRHLWCPQPHHLPNRPLRCP